MSPQPFVSRAKALPATRSEKGYGDWNAQGAERETLGTRLFILLLSSDQLHEFKLVWIRTATDFRKQAPATRGNMLQ